MNRSQTARANLLTAVRAMRSELRRTVINPSHDITWALTKEETGLIMDVTTDLRLLDERLEKPVKRVF